MSKNRFTNRSNTTWDNDSKNGSKVSCPGTTQLHTLTTLNNESSTKKNHIRLVHTISTIGRFS